MSARIDFIPTKKSIQRPPVTELDCCSPFILRLYDGHGYKLEPLNSSYEEGGRPIMLLALRRMILDRPELHGDAIQGF